VLGGGAGRWVGTAWSHLRSLPTWSLPPVTRFLVVGVPAAATLAIAAAVPTTRFRLLDALVFTFLVVLAIICMEVNRRLGEPAGLARDMISAWWLPLALLLPPIYVMLAPLPLNVVTHKRVTRTPMHRRVFTIAAISLPYGLASWAFHALPWLDGPPGHGVRPLIWVATVLVAGAVCVVVNILLLAVAMKFASAETPWHEVLWNKEKVAVDTVEVCAGACIAVLCAAHPLLAVVALPPLLMLQRSLMFTQLRSAARLDAKTGLLNALTWEREAANEVARARRTSTPLAVMLLDLDLFKQVNDHYGHLVGDRMLRAVSDALRGQLREYDVVGRFGGEEFAILLPQTEPVQARLAAERLRRCVAAAGVAIDDGITVTVTASIGLALFTGGAGDVPDLLAAADAALYEAKRDGRNRVVLARPLSGAAEPAR
jgi:diguanylate cyclase (GGDEF)-like protein